MLPKRKPQEGQLFWMFLLAVGWMVLGSAWGSSSSSSDLHLLSPTPGAPQPPALPRPDHAQGPRGPKHHQPPVSIYRSPASLRAGHGESCHHLFPLPVPPFWLFLFLSIYHHGWPEWKGAICSDVSIIFPPKQSHNLPPTISVFVFLFHSPSSTTAQRTNDSWQWHCIVELCIVYKIIVLIVSERHRRAKHPQWLYQPKNKWPLWITLIPPGFMLL